MKIRPTLTMTRALYGAAVALVGGTIMITAIMTTTRRRGASG